MVQMLRRILRVIEDRCRAFLTFFRFLGSMESTPRITAAEVNRDFVLNKCSYFADVHIWPLRKNIDPELWLTNFLPEEMDHAIHLLNGFLYFPEEFIDEMFKSAFQALSAVVVSETDSFLTIQTAWREFVDRVIITNVTGEQPNISDSGISFTRRAKQVLNISEERTLSNEDTLKLLLSSGPRPVVFVDDFVGSGNQFIDTWERSVRISSSVQMSFKKLASVRGNRFFYSPLICTQYGSERIETHCPEVILKPAHLISKRYNVFAADSLIWPDHLQPTATEFIKTASKRAGIPTAGSLEDWQGFHRLGLALAFADSVPDATLPIFTTTTNNWKPLTRRA
jgi:hypothetical protein